MSKPADWIVQMHVTLYPERYTYLAATDHLYWDGFSVPDPEDPEAPTLSEAEAAWREEHDCFEWSSETIEWVGDMLTRSLADPEVAADVEWLRLVRPV